MCGFSENVCVFVWLRGGMMIVGLFGGAIAAMMRRTLSEDEAKLRHSKRTHNFHCSGTQSTLFIRQIPSEHCGWTCLGSSLVSSAC